MEEKGHQMTTMGDTDCRGQVAASDVFVVEDGGQAGDNMDTTNTLQTSSENITVYSGESLRDLDSADLSDSQRMDIDDEDDNVFSASQPTGDSKDGGSDSDSASEGTCLGCVMSDGQDYYLRLGDMPRRRSALRLSRIIARQQLLRRLTQVGTYGATFILNR